MVKKVFGLYYYINVEYKKIFKFYFRSFLHLLCSTHCTAPLRKWDPLMGVIRCRDRIVWNKKTKKILKTYVDGSFHLLLSQKNNLVMIGTCLNKRMPKKRVFLRTEMFVKKNECSKIKFFRWDDSNC